MSKTSNNSTTLKNLQRNVLNSACTIYADRALIAALLIGLVFPRVLSQSASFVFSGGIIGALVAGVAFVLFSLWIEEGYQRLYFDTALRTDKTWLLKASRWTVLSLSAAAFLKLTSLLVPEVLSLAGWPIYIPTAILLAAVWNGTGSVQE